ncbi:mitochondrial outer membrane protein porin of 36 kDa-like [Prunus avium]|uniref:Mitochondrial outer membrane protein porin of 36 kDa-like n=1 Tax=Prunus avium TaxID=42229 RepID=A0A6P5RU62_PRUAV|nr:mitochondrial outer membrane protein porin of 36 kDa-like [Prunus avium]
MSNTSGSSFNIGKEARDLLYKDFAYQPPVRFDYRSLNWSSDVSGKVKLIAPGLSTLFSFTIPDYGRVELQYENPFVGIAGGIGLIRNSSNTYDPVANLSGVVGIGGSSLFTIGADLAADIATGAFDKFNAGLGFNGAFSTASLSLDKLDTLKASWYHMVNPLTNTALGAELKHSFSTNDTALAVGARHAFLPSTLAKARVSTHGSVGVVIQQGFWQKIFMSISGEVDFVGMNKSPTIGLSLAVRL